MTASRFTAIPLEKVTLWDARAFLHHSIGCNELFRGTVHVFDRNLHLKMPLVPTPARLKLLHVGPMTFLPGVHSSYRLTP
jgi:hypothetical protein